MSTNPIVWWELASHDAEKSVAFFQKVFGWDIKWDERVGVYDVQTGQEPQAFSGGGIFTLRKARLPFLALYIVVDDIEAKVQEIVAAGGHLRDPITDVPGGSKICLFNEPSGVTFALLQPKAQV